MIAVRDMVRLEARAKKAIADKDGAALDAVNVQAVKSNFLFVMIDGQLCLAAADLWALEHRHLPCYAEEWREQAT